jgi:hypothetical protein
VVSQFTVRCRFAATYQFDRHFKSVASVERLVTCRDTFALLGRIGRGCEPYARMRLKRIGPQVRSVREPEPERPEGRLRVGTVSCRGWGYLG